MNKENKKKAQQRKAKARAKKNRQNRAAKIIGLWGPVVLFVLIVAGLVVAVITSNDTASTDSEDTESTTTTTTTESTEETSSTTTVYYTTEGMACEDGDTVNIDFTGYLDGVAFEGGSTDGAGYDIVLGSDTFIDGFEDQVVGMTIGETKDITVTFPDTYTNNEDLAGQEVVFTVTLNGIYVEVDTTAALESATEAEDTEDADTTETETAETEETEAEDTETTESTEE